MPKSSDQNGKSEKTSIVVVGVDGSAGAKAALRWAVAEARLRNSPVLAVHAWTFDYPYWGDALGLYTSLGIDRNNRAAEDLLERAIADVGTDGIEIDRKVVQGPAAEALVQAASPRDLLVVGSRGHGGFTGLLLGSVSQQCVHHAPCPVVVVHAAKSPTAREPAAARSETHTSG
jgi:nucleotide-binding universal stress UspA family protein